MDRCKRVIVGSVSIMLTIMACGVLASEFAENNSFSPKIDFDVGAAHTAATKFDNSHFFNMMLTMPIEHSKYSVGAGWMNFDRFSHKDLPDTGIDTQAFVVSASRQLYRRNKIGITAGIQSLAYTSKTIFLNRQIDKHRSYTTGVDLRMSYKFTKLNFNAGFNGYRDISNSKVYVIFAGITLKLGPLFHF